MEELTLEDLPNWVPTLGVGVLMLIAVAWARIIRRMAQQKPILARRLRRRVPWGLDGSVLVVLLLFTALMSAFASMMSFAEEEPVIEIGLREVGLQAGIQMLFMGLAIAIVVINNPRLRWSDFGLTTTAKRLPRDLTFGVLATAALLPLVYASQLMLLGLFGEPTAHPAIEQLLSDSTPGSFAAVAFLAVVVAPVFEEFAFRVLFQGGLEGKTSRRAWWPIWASAITFGMVHTNQGYAWVSLVVFALGLGYVYRQTHSYLAVVTMHMSFNALSVAYAYGLSQAMAAK